MTNAGLGSCLAISPARPLAQGVVVPRSSPPPESVNRPGIAVSPGPVPLAAGAALGWGRWMEGEPDVAKPPSRARTPRGLRQSRSIHHCRRHHDDGRNSHRTHNSRDSRRTHHRADKPHILDNRYRWDYTHIDPRSRRRGGRHGHGSIHHGPLHHEVLGHDFGQLTRLAARPANPPKPKPAYSING